MKSTYTAQKKEEGVFRSWRWLWICTAGTGWLTQRKRKDAKKNILFRETTIPTPCRKYRQRRNIQKEGIDRHTLLRNRWRAWHLFELLSLLLSLRFFLALFIMAIEVFGIDVERKLQLGLRILTNFQLQNFVWDLLWIWVAASIIEYRIRFDSVVSMCMANTALNQNFHQSRAHYIFFLLTSHNFIFNNQYHERDEKKIKKKRRNEKLLWSRTSLYLLSASKSSEIQSEYYNQVRLFRFVCIARKLPTYSRFLKSILKKKTLHETYDYRCRHMSTTLLLQLQPPQITSLVFVLATFTSCFYYCALPTTYSFGQQVVSEE